jgi:hypothetical protein
MLCVSRVFIVAFLVGSIVSLVAAASSGDAATAFGEEQSRKLQAAPVAEQNPHQLPWHHGHHFNHTGGHKKAWMHFKEVDGLKNEEVAVFVMSSTTNEGMLLRER